VSSRANRDFDRLLRDENFWELTKEMSFLLRLFYSKHDKFASCVCNKLEWRLKGFSSESSKSVCPHTTPDERPLKWRWPEPRTARSDCVACMDAHVSKGELLSDLQDMLSCLLDLQIELGLYAEDDRLHGKR
jgi:hypothetical protein